MMGFYLHIVKVWTSLWGVQRSSVVSAPCCCTKAQGRILLEINKQSAGKGTKNVKKGLPDHYLQTYVPTPTKPTTLTVYCSKLNGALYSLHT